ncbi:MAG: HypC/HybG/HupF family hydrogenase formation chaperone [Nocardioidaceae bacterium]|nr:HypC/HybG/HupF family hydrogenase formation chaperone [Nocardioidaceae bacterium]
MCLAVPGRVISIEERDLTTMAEVDFGGVKKDVCLQYIPDITIGEYVMVHVGFAIQRMDEEAALETLANFEKLGILEEEFGDGFALAARQAGEPYVPEEESR